MRLLYDRFGSTYAHYSTLFRPARKAGVKVASISHASPLRGRFQVNLRNHRKVAVIDGRIGFTGGINVGDLNLSARAGGEPIRDYHLFVAGPAVSELQLRASQLARDQAELALRDAELALERRVVRAPIDGWVGILGVDIGDQVTSATEVATLDDRSHILVDFRVPERFVGQVKLGAPVSARPLARPGLALEGEVVTVDSRIDADTRTLRVRASLDNADDALRETLKTMSALVVEPASLSIPLLGAGLGEDGMVADPAVSSAILRSLAALHAAVVDGAAEHGPNSPYP